MGQPASRVVIAALLLFFACFAPSAASAHCSREALLNIAHRIDAATDDIATIPSLALSTLQAADDDLKECFKTKHSASEGWSILVVHEQARIEAAGAIASQGHLSSARDLIRAVRLDLDALSHQARNSPPVLRIIAILRRETVAVDDVAHNAQRIASMKVAGARVFGWPEAKTTPATRAARAPSPTCSRPNVPATTVRAAEPETPAIAQQQNISGTVQVIVSLDARSNVIGTKIQSSPSTLLNEAALNAARQSKYQTEIRDCKPIASEYIYSVEFSSQ